jgi:hypothetical protein
MSELETEANEAEPNTIEQPEHVEQRDYDKEARDMGWVPEAEFRGPKEKWKPAKDFVKAGEEILPIVRSQLQREREARERDKADFAKRLERMDKMAEQTQARLKAAHDAEIAKVKREMRAAVAAGDEQEFDRLEKVRDGLEKTAPKVEEPVKATPEQDLQTRQEAWRAENKWFDEDFEMQDFAIRYSDFHGRRNPHLSFEENMKVVEAKVKEKFPDRFGGKKAAGHTAVDGGSDFAGVFPGKGPAAKLKAEELRQAQKDVSAKLYKNVDEWAKAYFAG